MEQSSKEKVDACIHFLQKSISNCRNMETRFQEGSPQHSLLTRRIKSLQISKAILEKAQTTSSYSLEELQKALPPLESILQKTKKAQEKHGKDSASYKRFQTIISSVSLAKDHVEKEMEKRGFL